MQILKFRAVSPSTVYSSINFSVNIAGSLWLVKRCMAYSSCQDTERILTGTSLCRQWDGTCIQEHTQMIVQLCSCIKIIQLFGLEERHREC